MHRRSFASEGTLPKATRRARKRVRNAEAYISTLRFGKCIWKESVCHIVRRCFDDGVYAVIGGESL